MFVHCFASTLSIPLPDGRVDALVIHQRTLERDTIGKLCHAAQYRPMDSLEQQLADTVATCMEDRVVKCHICSEPFLNVLTVLHGSNRGPQSIHVLRSSPFRCARGKFRLDN